MCTLNFNNYRIVLGFHLGHIISLLHYYLYMVSVNTICKLNEIGYDIQPLVLFLLCLYYCIVGRRCWLFVVSRLSWLHQKDQKGQLHWHQVQIIRRLLLWKFWDTLLIFNNACWGLSLKITLLTSIGPYDVLGSGYKYIHCDMTYLVGFQTITFIVGSTFLCMYFPKLNVGMFVSVSNFNIMLKNKYMRKVTSLPNYCG